MMKRLLALALLVGPLSTFAADVPALAQAATPPPPLTPIASLDLTRYMGDWYEVARYPNWFQRKCGPSVARYSLKPGGGVEVDNSCALADGREDRAVGEARRVGAADSATLEVRFAPAWLSFIPLVWGNYWVIDLDDAYTLAAVSEPRREYLWILSRQRQPDAAAVSALLGRLKARGFDLSRLQMIQQAPAAAAADTGTTTATTR